MRRRLLLLAAIPLLLSACGGGGSSKAVCTQQYWDGTIGVCLPDGWNVVARETLDERGLPAEVIAAFQAEKAVSGQFPTVTVTEEKLTQDADSAAYSKASIRAVSTLPGYKLIDSRSVTIDGNAVDMHVFSAQPLPEEPERRFYQVSVVGKNRTGYTFTALTPLSIGSGLENEVTTIVKSSTLKEPAAQSSSK